jgi:hypothetical protein
VRVDIVVDLGQTEAGALDLLEDLPVCLHVPCCLNRPLSFDLDSR